MEVHFFDDERALADETWEVPADAQDPRAWALRRAAAFVEQRLGLLRPVPVTVRDAAGEWDIVLLRGGAAIDATPADTPGADRAAGTPKASRRARQQDRQGQQRGRDAQPRQRARNARAQRNAQGHRRGVG
jgi:hypothetical protein